MADRAAERLIDLSHVIEAGMTTYKGLPAPIMADYWSREASASMYDDGASFHIGRIDMVANTGTYIDAPFHRYAEGADIAARRPSISTACARASPRPSPPRPCTSTSSATTAGSTAICARWRIRCWRKKAN